MGASTSIARVDDRQKFQTGYTERLLKVNTSMLIPSAVAFCVTTQVIGLNLM